MMDVFYCGMGAVVILAILMAIDPQFDCRNRRGKNSDRVGGYFCGE